MKTTKDTYPVYEANQVLSNASLNATSDFHNEQQRLTRANLIGIGIVCGLELSVETTTIHITKGCGITSEGYLIVQSDEVILGRYKEYLLPEEQDTEKYAPFIKPNNTQYGLLEIVADDANNQTNSEPLTTAVLNGKAVLVFLELKKDNLRNCSINNCDDRGSKITATIRYLLIAKTDIVAIIAKANELPTTLTASELKLKLLARLNLPDLRLPRYDVLNSNLTTSEDVLLAFHNVFSLNNLVTVLGNALGAAYGAFKPLLQTLFPNNPFINFNTTFNFLSDVPNNINQVSFLQYYYDFFDDLIQAYDEFRWKAVVLLCACCPSEKLFPRHLILGLVFPASEINASVYRQGFLASSAISDCDERSKEVVLLFRRLVEMIAKFTNTPLPQSTSTQIRITPSKLADVPLSDKAIPYYYQQNGATPLFKLWNPEKNRHNRANQNLSYRSDEYPSPVPAFITNPLSYDLESYNFLRIEGHLGKNYQEVTRTLIESKSLYRLPIEIIALRTGVFDETAVIDLSGQESIFQDLEIRYDVLKAEFIRSLLEEVQGIYAIDIDLPEDITVDNPKPKLPLLVKYAPEDYVMTPNTFGWSYEYPKSWGIFRRSIKNPSRIFVWNTMSVISAIYDSVDGNLSQFHYNELEESWNNLVTFQEKDTNITFESDVDNRLEVIIRACHLNTFKVIYDEYVRRIRAVKQKYFLRYFLQKHPAIQHKAGVPLGGTFILVYHGGLKPTSKSPALDSIINETVNGFTDGDVIADFYLPYRVNIDGQAIQSSKLVVEQCTHEWIDSIKHINNLLLREYRFDSTNREKRANEKEKNRLKDFYVIKVSRYEIQGTSLINDSVKGYGLDDKEHIYVDIEIPKNELKIDKLSAVACAFNTTFPLGLVFDAAPPLGVGDQQYDSNKLLIRYLQGQRFCIELAGVQGNQIKYKYENGHRYRWHHKRWEELNPIAHCDRACQLLGDNYKAEAYQWLYENYPPQYPKPTLSPTVNDVIQWEKITRHRADRYKNFRDLPIGELLRKISVAISEIDENAQILLIGSWANGSWVSRHRSWISQYQDNPDTEEDESGGQSAIEKEKRNESFKFEENDTKDDIKARKYRFFELRRKVTGKTGYSDIDLLINSEFEITAEMIKVTSGYQINIIRGKENSQKGLITDNTRF